MENATNLLSAPAFWSAVAAMCSALAAGVTVLIHRRNLIESVRPVIMFDEWERQTKRLGKVFVEELSFRAIRNVGRGPAVYVYMNAFATEENKPLATMSTWQAAIIPNNDRVRINDRSHRANWLSPRWYGLLPVLLRHDPQQLSRISSPGGERDACYDSGRGRRKDRVRALSKLHEFAKGVQQANRLADIGFSLVYLLVFVLVDSRPQNAAAIEAGKYVYDGMNAELQSKLYSSLGTQYLNPRAGAMVIDYVQSMDDVPLFGVDPAILAVVADVV